MSISHDIFYFKCEIYTYRATLIRKNDYTNKFQKRVLFDKL